MDEKLKALYEQLQGEYDLGSFEEFSAKMQVPEKRKLLYDAVSNDYDLGDYKSFESKVVKKKVSTKEPQQKLPPYLQGSQKPSSTQPAAPTAGKSSDPQLDSLRKSMQEQEDYEERSSMTVQDYQSQTREQEAVSNIKKRRGTDFTSSAADMASGKIAVAGKRSKTVLETAGDSNMSFSDHLYWSADPLDAVVQSAKEMDQRSLSEFNTFSQVLSDENREIGLAIKGLEMKLKEEVGVDMDEYAALVSKYNAAQTALAKKSESLKLDSQYKKLESLKSEIDSTESATERNKLISEYNSLLESAQASAESINSEIEKSGESLAPIKEKISAVENSIYFEDMQKMYGAADANVKEYEDALKSGRFNHAIEFQKYLQKRQADKDERFKKMNAFEKVANGTGTVILHSAAKMVQSIGALTDVVEKATGLEGEKRGLGDKVQELMMDVGDDIQAGFPAPTKLQRGAVTTTAKWGDKQVDFDSNGDIAGLRDKDGYALSGTLTPDEEKEIKALPRERQFNGASFAYQAGSTIADVGVQILGTKGIGGIKAGVALTSSRMGGVGLKMAPLGTKFGATATVAGMMASDLYKEGLEHFDGPDAEENAARYALATGTTIGLINSVLGLGVEAQFTKVNGLLKSPLAGLSKSVEKAIGQRATNILGGIAGEEFEEMFLEKMGQAGVQYMMNEMAGGKFDIQPYKDVDALIGEAMVTAVAGGLFGFARKTDKKPNAMEQSMLVDGSKDIPATIEAVKAVAEANGEPLTAQQESDLKAQLEAVKIAVSGIPEEHRGKMEVVEATVEITKLVEENKALSESIKEKDPLFTADDQAKIKENDLKIAELRIGVAGGLGITPDPKAVKLIEAQKESVSEGGAVSEEGKVLEAPPVAETVKTTAKEDIGSSEPKVTEPTATEPIQPLSRKEAKKVAEQKVDEFASTLDTDLSGLPDEQVTRKILEEGSPAQVGQAWLTEPDVMQGEMFTKESAIEEAVTNSTFDPRSLEGIPDLSGTYFPKEGKKPNVYDLQELADELSEQTGMNITEADVADYIRSNPGKKKPKKISANPNKRLLGQKFKELTGIAPNKEYIDKLSERSSFLKEKQAVEQEFPEASETKPVQSGTERFRRRLADRQMEDVTIPLEVREGIRASGKVDYERLNDAHLTQAADYEIAENMKRMDIEDALDASVQTAKDLLVEQITSNNIVEVENNAAIAVAILAKTAYHYEMNGLSSKAIEVRVWQDVFSTGQGKAISALRGATIPEAVAGKVAMKAFESQVRELSKRGKNATLDQMLKDLKKEIDNARSGKSTGRKAAVSSLSKMLLTEERKKKLEDERAAILAKIKAQITDASLGAVYDPEQQAEKAAQLINNVALLVKNLVESGITKVQEIYENVVGSMKSIGFSDEDADRIWDAVKGEAEIVLEENVKLSQITQEVSDFLDSIAAKNRGITSKAQSVFSSEENAKLLEKRIKELADKAREQLESERKKLSDSAIVASTLLNAKEGLKSKNTEQEAVNDKYKLLDSLLSILSDNKKPVGKKISEAASVMASIKKQLRDSVSISTITAAVNSGFDKSRTVSGIVDSIGNELGLTPVMKEALRKSLDASMSKRVDEVNRKAVQRIMDGFKKKLAEEQIDGLMINEGKYKSTIEKLAILFNSDKVEEQDVIAAVSEYFGFTSMSAEDVADVNMIAAMMMHGLQSYAVKDASGKTTEYKPAPVQMNDVLDMDGKLIGSQPAWMPPPTGMKLRPQPAPVPPVPPAGHTIVAVNQKSQEIKARMQKDMKAKLLQIEKRNKGLMHMLPNELQAAMYMGALSNESTWYNVTTGTMWALAPSLLAISVDSPIAAINAIRDIKKSGSKQWGTGLGAFVDAFKTNFSVLASDDTFFDGTYTSQASLLEAAMVQGWRKQAERYHRETGIPKAKAFTNLVLIALSQAYRAASAPMGIDSMLTYPVIEYVRYLETWNKMSKDLQYKNLPSHEFAKKVAEYGKFTKSSWDLAKSQARAEVEGMKLSKKKVPHGFESRRAHEILRQSVREAEVESAMAFMKRNTLRGEMTGLVGVGYDTLMSAATAGGWAKNLHWSVKIPLLIKNSILLFMRTAIQGANFIERMVPFSSATYRPFFSTVIGGTWRASYKRAMDNVAPDANWRQRASQMAIELWNDSTAKYVGEKRMDEYPKEEQLGGGFVRKSHTENVNEVYLQVGATLVAFGLAAAMFDGDDEDEKLADDRWVDISAGMDNNEFNTVANDGMKRYSIRFRKGDGTWGDPISYALWLPMVPWLAVIGGKRDDILYRNEERKARSMASTKLAQVMDIFSAMSEMSFNGNAQTVAKLSRASRQAQKEDSPAPYGTAVAEIALRPFKAMQPGLIRDAFVNELGVMTDTPVRAPKGLKELVMKDIPILDNYIGHDRYDEYGYPIYRESKPLKILERMTFTWAEFESMNEKTRKNPEWVLTGKFEGLVTPGQYYPGRDLRLVEDLQGVGKKGDLITEEERILMKEAVAKRKGSLVKEYYEDLRDMNKQELEQMLSKIHNFAGDIIKFEMGYSIEEPEFNFSKAMDSIEEKTEEEQ